MITFNRPARVEIDPGGDPGPPILPLVAGAAVAVALVAIAWEALTLLLAYLWWLLAMAGATAAVSGGTVYALWRWGTLVRHEPPGRARANLAATIAAIPEPGPLTLVPELAPEPAELPAASGSGAVVYPAAWHRARPEDGQQ